MAQYYNTNLTNVSDLIFYLDAVNPRSYSGSGSAWYDLSPNGNHFTLFNTPTYIQNGAIGTYLTFNGTNQYARSANAINFNAYSAVTIEIGYRSTVTNATQILYETTGTGGSTATGGITLLMNANGTSTVANSYLSMWQGYGPRSFGYTVSTNSTFNSVVETFVNGSDSTGRQAYVNGTTAQFFTNTAVTVVTSATTTGLSFANTWTFVASRVGTSNFFRGDIAYIRAWGRKLGTTDIATNVSAIAARQPNSYALSTILGSDPSVVAPSLYPFTTFTFTSAGSFGRYGPSLATLQSTYSAQSWASNPAYFTEGRAQGYQVWQVPQDGIYEIEVAGARGQDSSNPGTGRGRGAIIRARVSLTTANKLEMVVGQVPGNTGLANGNTTMAGGGGGSFVVLQGTSTPVIIAGAGAGSYASYTTQAVVDGQTREQPRWDGYNYSPAVLGTDPALGFGGLGYHGGGGGGLLGGGVPYSGYAGSAAMSTDPSGQQTTHGASFVGGTVDTAAGTWYATGGNATILATAGGFGGGGGGHSGNNSGGGGGGYSGGLGGQSSLGGGFLTGVGGGSFIRAGATNVATSDGQFNGSGTFGGSAITSLGAFNDASGYIKITKI